MDRLRFARKRAVGSRQTVKAIERGAATTVFVATDAEEHITRPVVDMCQRRGVEVVYVPSMIELGRACGIQVGAACAAILRADEQADNTAHAGSGL